MRKIVVPTDFSENAFNALKFAAELFKHEKSEFYVLHAYADEVYNSVGSLDEETLKDTREKVKQNSDKELETIITRIKDLFSNPRHNFHSSSAFGLLVDEVNDLAEQENADIIVTSTRGKNNERNLTFGSNSLQIIKYVQCPVLSIPAGYEFDSLQLILFPTNFLLPYQKRELKLAADLARAFCAKLHMMYVSKFPLDSYRQKDNQEAIKEQFYDVKTDFHQEEKLEKREAIFKAIDEMEIDLLILVNSRHSYLENVLYSSTIDEIGLHPKIPFLVLQNFSRT